MISAQGEEALSWAEEVDSTGGHEEGTVGQLLTDLNVKLDSIGVDFQVGMAEWLTHGESGQVGQTVFANDKGDKQQAFHWVPFDPRRTGLTDIFYVVDMVDGVTSSGLSAATTEAAIDRAMDTWNAVNCSTIPVVDDGALYRDLGIMQRIFGYGGTHFFIAADITHAGWLPGGFFDILEPGGSNSILGVTFTFIWIDYYTRQPTDIDGNGRLDVAFKEIYYNDNFWWSIDGDVDVETVALHESGHGLSQEHFGRIFKTDENEKMHYAPLAVMNASYSGIQQDLKGTDNGGHCYIWEDWPYN
jgi:hypothetical protein